MRQLPGLLRQAAVALGEAQGGTAWGRAPVLLLACGAEPLRLGDLHERRLQAVGVPLRVAAVAQEQADVVVVLAAVRAALGGPLVLRLPLFHNAGPAPQRVGGGLHLLRHSEHMRGADAREGEGAAPALHGGAPCACQRREVGAESGADLRGVPAVAALVQALTQQAQRQRASHAGSHRARQPVMDQQLQGAAGAPAAAPRQNGLQRPPAAGHHLLHLRLPRQLHLLVLYRGLARP
mmetsp:Transcript_4685/g.11717  ORF Transcript_4685/g.11717 Transcript_4685/m.11717 type:complete len:236 (-) Transcript_4685:1825-2532(-)